MTNRSRNTSTSVPMEVQDLIRHILEHLKATYGTPRLRRDRDPLDTLIETVLSQSTNDRNRDRAFARLKARFPTWEAVRRAPTREIAAAIRVGGLARIKSARIKRILQEIERRTGALDLSVLCRMPLDEALEFLRSLDGVGPKTAACVLLFACGRPVFPVDTHIRRVAGRLGLIPPRCSDERAHEQLGRLIPTRHYYAAHINLIRLGRDVCRPRNPRCEACCLVQYCAYAHEMGKI
ncbi:MAG: endonuclease III [Blastocatellia bacterium]|nr:endonuclease III [Blastocatellia bacterium]MCS7156440.1 endonuclease III [Blastocatellia bacterium]MCX7751819.1 endonuclease III [Blastocatellia bacterium]MDW8168921.1 endonuclease III [Acidobacteriota bacterium]MDW8256681.1 endonuclease III [Acidobacteriota bacterium]